jgi:hypothetical protein
MGGRPGPYAGPMSGTTEMPTWAVWAVSLGSPILAFLGAVIGHLVSRRTAKELELRSRREQLIKMLQWGAELAVSGDDDKARLGLGQLKAVEDSELCDSDVQAFVDAALEAVVGEVADEVDADPDAVIEAVDAATLAADARALSPIHLPEQQRDGGDGQ